MIDQLPRQSFPARGSLGELPKSGSTQGLCVLMLRGIANLNNLGPGRPLSANGILESASDSNEIHRRDTFSENGSDYKRVCSSLFGGASVLAAKRKTFPPMKPVRGGVCQIVWFATRTAS